MKNDSLYVYRASLAQLIGDSDAVSAVEMPGKVPRDLLVAAVAEVKARLCPYPAIRIADWFWTTTAGQITAQAEWILYGAEAMRPSQVCRALWGAARRWHYAWLEKLTSSGELPVYPMPRTAQRGSEYSAIYIRRSDVQRLADTGRYERGPEELPKPTYVDPDPPPAGFRRCARRERCLNPEGPILPATLEYFAPDKRASHGLDHACRKCRNEAFKQWQHDHPERSRAAKRRHYQKKTLTRKGRRTAIPAGFKLCSKRKACLHPEGPMLPATAEYFTRHRKAPDGLFCQCKKCARAERKRAEARLAQARLAQQYEP